MYTALAILGSIIGLFVTATAAYTGWLVYQDRKRRTEAAHLPEVEEAPAAHASAKPLWQRWMLWDAAVLLLFGIGAVFLLTDLAAVYRDRDLYPPYHFGYLLCGFTFSVLAMLFAAIRLLALLRSTVGRLPFAPDHQDQPHQTDHAERRVENG